MLNEITSQPIFGITITLATYIFGVWLNKKTKSVFANPLLISSLIIIAFLLIFKVPLENYKKGSVFIEMLIAPATTALALIMYEKFETIKKNFSAIMIGCFVGAFTSIVCVTILCNLLNIQNDIYLSMIAKSVTTAIAVQTTEQIGGIVPIACTAVFLTGFFIGVTAPFLIKVFRIKNKIAAGIALGTSGHAFATSKAIEIGEIEAAMSGIAIGMCGLATVIFLTFI